VTTEENLGAPHPERQDQITVGGQTFWADRELIPLLRALNEAGLRTRSHCSGHGEMSAWVAIRTDNISGVEIRNWGEYKEILLTWEPSWRGKRCDSCGWGHPWGQCDNACPACGGYGDGPESCTCSRDEPVGINQGSHGHPDQMCPNCVTPWKCNGPHIPQSGSESRAEIAPTAGRDGDNSEGA
jgi:hypothetical protein